MRRMGHARRRAFERYVAGLSGADIAAAVARSAEEAAARRQPCAVCGRQTATNELRYNTRAHDMTPLCDDCWRAQDTPF